MKKSVFLLSAISIIMVSSCMVEQHSVNTSVQPFQNGGRLFGESTKGMQKGVDYQSSGTLFVVGINTMNDAETNEMVSQLNAEKYTIQTKNSFLGGMLQYLSYGLITHKKTTVIKRSN